MFEKDDDAVAGIWRRGALQLMQQPGRHAANADAWAQNAKEWEAHALGFVDTNLS
jgi:hypothetical protein